MKDLIKYETGKSSFVMMRVDDLEWSAIGHVSKVCLDEIELKRCKLLNKDIEKFLKIKQHLINGYNPTETARLAEVSRQTVYNYKALMSKTTLKIVLNIQEIYTKKLKIVKSVYCFPLIASSLSDYCTVCYTIAPIAPLLLFLGYLFWKDHKLAKWQKEQARKIPARSPFLKAYDLAHRKELIIVSNKKQLAAINRLLKAYKNSGRKVELLEYRLDENESDYFDRKEELKRQHLIENLELIKAAKAGYYIELNKLYRSGKLDYLRGDLDNLTSKSFVEAFTQALEAENL